jgi:hypothetical protein
MPKPLYPLSATHNRGGSCDGYFSLCRQWLNDVEWRYECDQHSLDDKRKTHFIDIDLQPVSGL